MKKSNRLRTHFFGFEATPSQGSLKIIPLFSEALEKLFRFSKGEGNKKKQPDADPFFWV